MDLTLGLDKGFYYKHLKCPSIGSNFEQLNPQLRGGLAMEGFLKEGLVVVAVVVVQDFHCYPLFNLIEFENFNLINKFKRKLYFN